MDKVIIFTNEDGSCGVIYPSPKCGLTIEEIAAKDVPEGLFHRITTKDNIPTERDFRNAWTDTKAGMTVDVDVEKAKGIHMDNLRGIRNKKLEALDIETLKGNDVQVEKQVLRDLPETIDLSGITTAEELRNFLPEELK